VLGDRVLEMLGQQIGQVLVCASENHALAPCRQILGLQKPLPFSSPWTPWTHHHMTHTYKITPGLPPMDALDKEKAPRRGAIRA
jgi:hypothetical protein